MDLTTLLNRLSGVRKSGDGWTAKCPAHDDRVPSLSLFWGRDGRLHAHCHKGCSLSDILAATGCSDLKFAPKRTVAITRDPAPCLGNIQEIDKGFKAALPGSLGELYLSKRKIPLEIAMKYGLGYAKPGDAFRPSPHGRLVFPHMTPSGKLINLYGRAIEWGAPVQRKLRHDHLPGDKAIFNAPAILQAKQTGEPLYVCEGPFDALALIASGRPNAIAIFGTHGFKWRWFVGLRRVILAMDNDQAGKDAMMRVLPQARESADIVERLPDSLYGGCSDLGEAWARGVMQ